jgi:hypothetical protein
MQVCSLEFPQAIRIRLLDEEQGVLTWRVAIEKIAYTWNIADEDACDLIRTKPCGFLCSLHRCR